MYDERDRSEGSRPDHSRQTITQPL